MGTYFKHSILFLRFVKQQQRETKQIKTEFKYRIQKSQLEQMEIFREKLEEFAMKHKEDIKKNSQFRKQFQEMCAIGVDPLASGKGGFMELNELRKGLIAARGQSSVHHEITNEDILMAAKKVSIFGNRFVIHKLGKGKYIVQSIPSELSTEDVLCAEDTSILTLASDNENGNVNLTMIKEQLGWTDYRARQSLEKVLREGLCWIDDQDIERCYWFPSLFPARTTHTHV